MRVLRNGSQFSYRRLKQPHDKTKTSQICIYNNQSYALIRIARALSLVNMGVQMRICNKYGCDFTRILIGYVLSDARFDWLVGNMKVYLKKSIKSKK